MLLSFKWLEQYLPKGLNVSKDELRERLTIALTEVEGYKHIGKDLEKIVVGQIKEVKKHPKSDKLLIAKVDVGTSRKRTIVCGAKNIFESAKVPVALPGGQVLSPEQKLGKQKVLKISEVEIQKVKSSGMLASQKELGISDNHSEIWILPDEIKVGEDFKKIIEDTVLEIENKALTHRPDCFSHLGIAREISAIMKVPFDYQESDETLIPTQTLPLVVKVENKELCKRYTAIAMQGVEVKPSPLWLQLRLLACGIRPINNIVDATNYVMLDVGQPIHAFDYNKLESPRVIVRTAKSGEKITTLDEDEKELEKDHLLITDPSGPIAIAGVMGGKDSEVDENTKDIIIESANFEMYSTRKTSMKLGCRTEASMRFEKGLDPNLTISALRKVVTLINDIAGGEIASELIDIYPQEEKEKTLEFDINDIPKLLGIEISKEEIIDDLESLSLEVNSPEASTSQISVTIPTFRQDLKIKEDLLEEVARIYGYDKFKPSLPKKDLKPAPKNKKRSFERKVKKTLSALGFDEIYAYSFIGKDSYEKTLLDINKCSKIINPLAPQLTYLRNNLVPGLLSALKVNTANFDSINFYEMGRVVLTEKNEQDLPNQPKLIGIVSAGNKPEDQLYFDLKGKVEALLDKLHINNVKYKNNQETPYLTDKIQVNITKDNSVIGKIGALNPKVKHNWDLEKNVVVCELNVEKLFEVRIEEINYQKVNKYPYVKRDLSFWITKDKPAGEIIDKLREIKSDLVKQIKITDIYFDKKDEERKSITIKVTLQSQDKTLTEEEITAEIEKVTKLIQKLGGKLRK